NDQGLVSGVADGTGNSWAYGYDPAGHLTSVTALGNLTTTYTYDTGGNPETVNALTGIGNPDGSQVGFTYDPATGRLTGSSENGGASSVTYAYPGQGEVTVSDSAGDQSITWYNDLGLAGRVEDPLGNITSYAYDANGNLTGYTDPAGGTYHYGYDS